jgi:mannose-6-phosphate isomerase-like protein (cupin superfamily)
VKRELTPALLLGDAFAHLCDGGEIRPLSVDATFWTETAPTLPAGKLVSVFESAQDWTVWEMHPEGDELVLLLSGCLRLHFDRAGENWLQMLRAGEFVIAPAGVWHTADVIETGKALFITAGANTQHRDRVAAPNPIG